MTRYGLMIALLGVLWGPATVRAGTDADVFLAVLKRFGVTGSFDTNKKPCLCTGGAVDGTTGLLTVLYDSGLQAYDYDCEVPFFDSSGRNNGSASCRRTGGSVVVVPR